MSFKKVRNPFDNYNYENNMINVNKFMGNTLEKLKVEKEENVESMNTEEQASGIQNGNTSRLLGLWEGSNLGLWEASNLLLTDMNKKTHNIKQEDSVPKNRVKLYDPHTTGEDVFQSDLKNIKQEDSVSVPTTRVNLYDPQNIDDNVFQLDMKTNDSVKQEDAVLKNRVKLHNPHNIEDNVFELGRQKGISDILSSLISPTICSTQTNFEDTLDSPDLTLSFLERENLKLLNKLARNSGSLTNFDDSSFVYAGNESKEDSRVYLHGHYKDDKIKRDYAKTVTEDQIKIWLKPFWNTDIISKDEYKTIMLKCIRKISCWKEHEKTPVTIRRLVEFYIKKLRMDKSTSKTTKKLNKSSSKSVAKQIKPSKFIRSENLKDISNKQFISINDKENCRESYDKENCRESNITITINQPCCSKYSANKKSHKVVISDKKSTETRRWRY